MRRGRCDWRLSRHWRLRRHGLWLRVGGIRGLRLPGWGRHRPGRLGIRRLRVWLALRLPGGIRGDREAGSLLLCVARLLGLRVSLGLLLGITLGRLLRVTLRRRLRVGLLLRLGRIALRRLRRVTRLLRLWIAWLLLLLVSTRTPGGSRLGSRLPRGRRDRVLLIWGDVGCRGTLKGGLAASKQIL